jgi:hypothetical protein
MAEQVQKKWMREAIMVAAAVFAGSALRRAWWRSDEFPTASANQDLLIFLLSVAGVVGVAAVARSRRWGFWVAAGSALGLVVAYRSVGASWLVVALFLVAAFFLAIEIRHHWKEMH